MIKKEKIEMDKNDLKLFSRNILNNSFRIRFINF